MTKSVTCQKIGVVGGGIAGITAAYLLSKDHEVTLFEANAYLGGHTNTQIIKSGPDEGAAIDTGFIVCNPKNYPLFYKLLSNWGVSLQDSDMSFGYYSELDNLHYTGPGLREFGAIPLNFLKLKLIRLFIEQRKFNSKALYDLKRNTLEDITLSEYARQIGVSEFFISTYLAPLAGAIWSSPDIAVRDFPAATFIRFFSNHGMLELSKRPQWQTISGGSHTYIKAFLNAYSGKLLINRPVTSIQRLPDSVLLNFQDGPPEHFDKIVLATHADQALKLLLDPTPHERDNLSRWQYSQNHTVLHTDKSVLPKDTRGWASWNYYKRQNDSACGPVTITYYMNRLQRLQAKNDYFVTLNLQNDIDPNSIIFETVYTHPIYNLKSIASQAEIQKTNGSNNTYYCGSYLRYGFHEDAVSSAVEVAKLLGSSL